MQKFFTGDVVKISSRSNTSFKKGVKHIVHKCEYMGNGDFEYSTNRGAWFSDEDFELLRRADEASFAELDKIVIDDF